MTLTELRKQIDQIDEKIVLAIARRLELVIKIGEYKKGKNIPVYCPQREEELIKEKRRLAEQLKLNPKFIDKLFRMLINESHLIQR